MTAITTVADFNRTLSAMSERVTVDPDRLRATIDSRGIEATSIMDLRAQLAGAVYTHLHIQHPGIENEHTTGEQDLAETLIAGIPHHEIVQPALALAPDIHFVDGVEHCAVELAGVQVLVPLDAVERTADGSETSVRVPSWRRRTTPGYLLVLGPSGRLGPATVTRLYVAFESADEATAIWPGLLHALGLTGVDYQAKALSASRAYPRTDAIVIYIAARDVAAVVDALTPLLPSDRASPLPASIFTRRVTDRISTATEPEDPRPTHRGMSFGQHRSRVLADALLRSTTEDRTVWSAWEFEARRAQIDPKQPALNLRS